MKYGYIYSLATGIALCIFSVTASLAREQPQLISHDVPRWFNPETFPGVSPGNSPYELQLDLTFTSSKDEPIPFESCQQLSSVADTDIADREYARWELVKAHCEAALRFHYAPASSISYWPTDFDLSLLRTFPATAVPYLGGQGMDKRTGTLESFTTEAQLIEATPLSIKLSLEDMMITYQPLVRGDFNRDGYEDILVSMSWYIPGTFGRGTDWIALTRTSAEAPPMLLWRK